MLSEQNRKLVEGELGPTWAALLDADTRLNTLLNAARAEGPADLTEAAAAMEPFASLILDADPEDPIPDSGMVHCLIVGDGELGELTIEHFRCVAEVHAKLTQTREAPREAPDGPCDWCSEPILPGQPTAVSDGQRMHLPCAADEADNATFDRDMGFD